MTGITRAGCALAAAFAVMSASAPSFADWSMFHGDLRHSGAAGIRSGNGVAGWSFPTSDTVEFTSPAVGPDGTIYVANLAGDLYALRNAGNLRWKMSGLSPIRYSTPAVATDFARAAARKSARFFKRSMGLGPRAFIRRKAACGPWPCDER